MQLETATARGNGGLPSSLLLAHSHGEVGCCGGRRARLCATWVSRLANCEPAPVALVALLLYLLLLLLTTKNSVQAYFYTDRSGCLPAEQSTIAGRTSSSAALFYATAAGVAAGCGISVLTIALVLRLVRRQHTVLRLTTLYVAAAALLEMYILFQLSSLDAFSKVCATPLGGRAPTASRQAIVLALYPYWLSFTTTQMAMLGQLAGASVARIRGAILAVIVMAVLGLVSSVYDSSFAGWVCIFVVVLVADCCELIALYQFLRAAYTRCRDNFTRGLLRALQPFSWLIWTGLVVSWGASRLGGTVYESVLPVFILLSNAFLIVIVTVGDFSVAAAETDTVLQSVDDARHAAEAANAAKREVMRYLFHEIRVPLNSIVLASEDLLAQPTPSANAADEWGATSPAVGAAPSRHGRLEEERDRREMIETIASSATDMTRLLNNFLSLEKVEAGKMELELEPTLVLDLLKQSAAAFAPALSNRSLSATLAVDPGVPAVVVMDPHRLRQCVSNCISNAIKFSPSGSTISLAAELVDCHAGVVASGQVSTAAGSTSPSSAAALSLIAASVTTYFQRMPIFASRQSTPAGSPVHVSRDLVRSDDVTLCFDRPPLASQSLTPHLGADVPYAGPAMAATADVGAAAGECAATHARPSPPRLLRITVTNNGSEISPADQEKLFSPFAQIRPGVQQRAGGTGLGLAICRRIVELHGGRVGVRSAEGETAFFMDIPINLSPQSPTSVLLPQLHAQSSPIAVTVTAVGAGQQYSSPPFVSLPAPPCDAHLASSTRASGSATFPGNSGRHGTSLTVDCRGHGSEEDLAASFGMGKEQSLVQMVDSGLTPLACAMVIDDIPSNRLLLVRLLQRRGVGRVAAFDGGHAALAAWRAMDGDARGALQCVFCDKEMPGDLDGHDTVAALRAEGFRGAILGVTGNALDSDRAAFLAAGADGVLAKPVSSERLTQGLRGMGLALGCGQ